MCESAQATVQPTEQCAHLCSAASRSSAATMAFHCCGTLPGSVKTHMTYDPSSSVMSTWKIPMQTEERNVFPSLHTTGHKTYGP